MRAVLPAVTTLCAVSLAGCPRGGVSLLQGASATPTPIVRDRILLPPNRVPPESNISGVNGTFGIQGQVRREGRLNHQDIRVSLLQGIGFYDTFTDDQGGYRFDGLKLGSYRLRFQADGYDAKEIAVALVEGSVSPPDQLLTSPIKAVVLQPAVATVSLPPPDNLQPLLDTSVRFTVLLRKGNGDMATASAGDFVWTPSYVQDGVFRADIDAATGPVTVVATLPSLNMQGIADVNVIEHPGETELQILSLPTGSRR
ncbi:MAG: carboxypeptidase-like regulatory domain-containing protein [Candidatus Sericytochromatia bacterium]|nr:carboxypeptidase-like regulatory domain-containing protein [Candidatus Sericytochromatia bacterium]